MIDISPEKVMHVALRALEYDGKMSSRGGPSDGLFAQEEAEAGVGNFNSNDLRTELSEFIDTLNIDEQEALVALTWIGRGTYSASDYKDALKIARSEHINETKDYLLGIPLLSEYLKEGLAQMGYMVEELEEDLVRRAPDWPSS